MSTNQTVDASAHLNRVRWACRRGMLELDCLLIPFFDNHYQSLTQAEQDTFEQLLTEPDPVIYAWLIGSEACDNEYKALVAKINTIQK